MARRVTLADVAVNAGVSRSTVSLVVQGSSAVAERTRERVTTVMQEMGYVYHRGAASLRMQRSSTVGLVIPTLQNPFYAELALGIEAELGPAGYVTFLANSFDDTQRQTSLVRGMVEHQVDGILLIPAEGSESDLVDWLHATGVPLVLMTRGQIAGARATHIGSDNRVGGRLAAEHLLGHGCTRLAYLGGPDDSTVRRERVAGVKAALAESGRRLAEDRCSPMSVAAGYELGKVLLSEGRLPDGVICQNDIVAFGFMRALRTSSPDDLQKCRVIGYDDVEQAAAWNPPLTSVSVMARDMGRRAARLFLERIEDPDRPVASLMVEPCLAIRESCGCPGDGR